MTALSNGSSYQYDTNGNMTCRVENSITYKQTYNAENRVSNIMKMNGDCVTGTITESWSFSYDGDGTRTGQVYTNIGTGSTLTTLYFMGGAYETTVETSAVKKYYAIAGMIVAMNDGSSLKYLLTDHLGSVVAVTDASGSVLSQQRYLPFGGVRTEVGNITQTDFGYTGQRALGMGLMDYHARFYDSIIGRFVEPDTIIPSRAKPQSLNRYSYVVNDPIGLTDPTGNDPWGCKNQACITREQNNYNNSIRNKRGGGGNGGNQGSAGQTADLGTFQLLPTSSSLSNILNTVWDRYNLGWTNFGSAWSIINNPNAPAIAKAYSGTYIFGWGGAHLVLVAGLIAIGADSSHDQQPAGYAPSEEGNRGPFKSPFGSPDLSQSPGDDWEWRTRNPEANPPGSPQGQWRQPDTGQQLHNDPYERTNGPHVDWTDPDGNKWRIWPDGSMSPK